MYLTRIIECIVKYVSSRWICRFQMDSLDLSDKVDILAVAVSAGVHEYADSVLVSDVVNVCGLLPGN
jgi:hypothetical protein